MALMNRIVTPEPPLTMASNYKSVNGSLNHTTDKSEKQRVIVFKVQQSIASELIQRDPNIYAIFKICVVATILFFLSNITLDSIKTGRFYWNFFYYLEELSWSHVIGAILVMASIHVTVYLIHPLFKLWMSLRTSLGRVVDIVFLTSYIFLFMASFVYITYICPYLQLPKFISVIIAVEQIRGCLKTYSFIRENAYKVLYPWHKDDTSGPAVWYGGQMSPTVGSFSQYCYFFFCPTLLYRDHYPRNQGPIKWRLVFINLALFIGSFTLMTQFCINMVVDDFHWKTVLRSFVSWLPMGLVIFSQWGIGLLHAWMNMNAELLQFGDRKFYQDWWCCETYSEFYRKWNVIPYHFNHQYIYRDLRKAFRSKIFAMFILILTSSLMHEYIMFVSLGFAVPLLTLLFAGVGILVVIFNLNGNFVVISCLTFGSYMICWFYFVEIGARRLCDREETFTDTFYPRMIECIIQHSLLS